MDEVCRGRRSFSMQKQYGAVRQRNVLTELAGQHQQDAFISHDRHQTVDQCFDIYPETEKNSFTWLDIIFSLPSDRGK